ncbi:MAG: glycogen-binding domain-containing protein [Elusimicrobium sp.]|jgi:hypothetical protein|nr:glycogen-binding domain-containing protein [Elusimicrobium sp.]
MSEEKEETNHTSMILALLILAVCLVVLFTAGKDYYETVTSKPAAAAAVPQPQNPPKPAPFDTEIKFRKFFITAPGAKQVSLAADFNDWGKTPIILTPYSKGYFETSVALAAGEYKYIFLVDGKETQDTVNKDVVEFNGRQVCVKTVK